MNVLCITQEVNMQYMGLFAKIVFISCLSGLAIIGVVLLYIAVVIVSQML